MKIQTIANVTLGAEVTDLDMNEIAPEEWGAIVGALDDHGLLRLQGQRFSAREVATFARRFGPLEGDIEEARPISNRGADGTPLDTSDPAWLTRAYPTRHWHADGMFNHVAPRVCVLDSPARQHAELLRLLTEGRRTSGLQGRSPEDP